MKWKYIYHSDLRLAQSQRSLCHQPAMTIGRTRCASGGPSRSLSFPSCLEAQLHLTLQQPHWTTPSGPFLSVLDSTASIHTSSSWFQTYLSYLLKDIQGGLVGEQNNKFAPSSHSKELEQGVRTGERWVTWVEHLIWKKKSKNISSTP